MCIFCGGACGGAGDDLLMIAAASMPLIMTRVRARWATRKSASRKLAASITKSRKGLHKVK